MNSDFECRVPNLPAPAWSGRQVENPDEPFHGRRVGHPLLAVVTAVFLTVAGCGKEGPPLPPEIKVAERTTDLTAFQEGDEAVLRWSYPTMTTAGQTLNQLEEIEIWRAAMPVAQEPPPPVSPQDRQLQRQLLEGQGEMIRALGPEDIAEATRGPAILFRDDLEQWRKSAVEPDSLVLWYGVRTVCCRHRESEFSNIVRMEPQAPPLPPTDLTLQAGKEGIDLEWTPAADAKTLVERSPDGAIWTSVTEDAVEGASWRDRDAPQGQAWSYRLRSMVGVPGGGRVVGQPCEPARIEHPDTYPPEIPSDIVCLPEGAQVRVRWRAVVGAVAYGVSRQNGDQPREVLTDEHGAIEFTDTSPPLGELIYFVTARDAAGNRSDEASCVVVMGAVP